jgi:endonuclease-3
MSSTRSLKDKLSFIYRELYARYGEPGCPLHHETPFQLLVATILSAQCTDRRVNIVTAGLFRRYPDAETMSKAEPTDVEPYIRTAGLYHAKAANLVGSARGIMAHFGGEVPQTMTELLSLPGIGRKTANVILGNAFEVPGFPVDTHVQRLSVRLGIAAVKDPVKIEKIVCAHIAPEYWTNFSHLLILHGREICNARKPLCGDCPLSARCQYYREEYTA